jgi:predicted RNA-binding Zn-ribbon protein involved in translation (DUF1610 family)
MAIRRPRGRRVLLCPKCGSADVSLIAGSILGQVYRCAKCDYVGSLIFETELGRDGAPPGQGSG